MANVNGNEEDVDEAQLLADLQAKIALRLNELGYPNDESSGDIVHHLAEVAVLGQKVFRLTLNKFLAFPLQRSAELADVAVELQHDLWEAKEAIEEMEPHLIKLVNFLNS